MAISSDVKKSIFSHLPTSSTAVMKWYVTHIHTHTTHHSLRTRKLTHATNNKHTCTYTFAFTRVHTHTHNSIHAVTPAHTTHRVSTRYRVFSWKTTCLIWYVTVYRCLCFDVLCVGVGVDADVCACVCVCMCELCVLCLHVCVCVLVLFCVLCVVCLCACELVCVCVCVCVRAFVYVSVWCCVGVCACVFMCASLRARACEFARMCVCVLVRACVLTHPLSLVVFGHTPSPVFTAAFSPFGSCPNHTHKHTHATSLIEHNRRTYRDARTHTYTHTYTQTQATSTFLLPYTHTQTKILTGKCTHAQTLSHTHTHHTDPTMFYVGMVNGSIQVYDVCQFWQEGELPPPHGVLENGV